MGENTHSSQVVLDSRTMSTHIYAIGQTADNEYIRTATGKVTNKTFTKVAPIIRTFTSTYDTDYAARIQVCVTAIEKECGGIITLA